MLVDPRGSKGQKSEHMRLELSGDGDGDGDSDSKLASFSVDRSVLYSVPPRRYGG